MWVWVWVWVWLWHVERQVLRQRLRLRGPPWIRVWGGARRGRVHPRPGRTHTRVLLRVPELEVERVRAGSALGPNVGVGRQRPGPRPHGADGAAGAICVRKIAQVEAGQRRVR